MSARFPDAPIVKHLLEGLLGRAVTVKEDSPLDAPDTVVVYANPEGELSSLATTDLPFACFSGAALSLIPRGHAEGAVEEGNMAPALRENFHEVVNVMSRLLNFEGGTRNVLKTVHYNSDAVVPEEVGELKDSLENELHLMVDIEGYGSGRVSIFG